MEWLRFLKPIDREPPSELDVHLIADNYCTHKHENVKAWLKKHPRFHMHFTPTSSSWLNLAERFFADITQEWIRDGRSESVPRLEKAIHAYIDGRNENPVPYRWVAEGAAIVKKINRTRATLNKSIYKTAH